MLTNNAVSIISHKGWPSGYHLIEHGTQGVMGNKIVVYTRVSTFEQTKGVSIEAQLDRLRSYAKFQGWTIKDEFVDAGC